MKNKFKILGVTQEREHCDRCGRTGLTKVYVIETGTGEEYSLGSTCIRSAYQMTQRELTAKLTSDQREAAAAARAEYRSTTAYREQKAYGSSPQHHRDMRQHGFTFVSSKFQLWEDVRQAIANKYKVAVHKVF